MNWHTVILAGWVGAVSAAISAEVGPPIEVAPQARETRNQTWASTEWCEGARCWLTVWREGYLNEPAGDIWCARISGDGKALDPAGIKLTTGKGFRDRPRVASDGKNFLVVWEEMLDGRYWDVFGAIVASEGNVPAEKPFLLAGGEHSQCRPDVAFAKGNYHVLWMGYDGNTYGIYGTRVSPDGKPAGGKPAVVASVAPRKPDSPVNVTLPVIAANQEGDLLSAFHVRDAFKLIYLARRPMDAATGQPTGTAPTNTGGKDSPGGKGWGGRERTVALAMGPNGAVTVSSAESTRTKSDAIIGQLSKTGEVLGIQEASAPALGITDPFKPISSRFAVSWTGDSYLAVGEFLNAAGDQKKRGERELYARVAAWRITQEGKVDGDACPVAGEAGRECMLPDIAAGPGGACLVVYSEIRGVDDTKVLARTIK